MSFLSDLDGAKAVLAELLKKGAPDHGDADPTPFREWLETIDDEVIGALEQFIEDLKEQVSSAREAYLTAVAHVDEVETEQATVDEKQDDVDSYEVDPDSEEESEEDDLQAELESAEAACEEAIETRGASMDDLYTALSEIAKML